MAEQLRLIALGREVLQTGRQVFRVMQ
jgi:hypothetical protein